MAFSYLKPSAFLGPALDNLRLAALKDTEAAARVGHLADKMQQWREKDRKGSLGWDAKTTMAAVFYLRKWMITQKQIRQVEVIRAFGVSNSGFQKRTYEVVGVLA